MSGDFMQGNGDSAVAVPFSDDETVKDEELIADDESSDSKASPEERVNRRQKRQERIKRLLDEGKQNAEENRALRAEMATLKGEIGGLKAAVQRPAPANDTGKDRYEQELDAIYEKQSTAYQAAQAEIKAGTFTPERSKHYEKIAREVESAKTRVHTQRELSQRMPAIRQEQAQQVWTQKYPDVYNNPSAYKYASATFERRQALGEVATNAMVDEIMSETMTQFKLGPKRAPSASERSRLSGVPSAGSGGGSSRSGDGITMTPELKRMAIARYSDLPEGEAIKKWVNGPGKRLRERKAL